DRAAFGFGDAREHAEVALAHQANFECRSEAFERLGVAREEQAPRSSGTEPMHRRPRPLGAEPQIVQMIHERRAARARPVHWQAARLVDHQSLAILVENRDRHASADAIRRIASASTASSAAKLMRKPSCPPNALAGTIAT